MVCGCYLAAYSDFFHGSILFQSRNLDYDCETSTLNIMLARFCQLHEVVVEQMLDPSFTSQYCYCKNLQSWKICDFCWKFLYSCCWKLSADEKKIIEVFKWLKVLNDFSKGITVIDPFFIFSTYKNLTLIKLDNPDYFPPLSDVDVA